MILKKYEGEYILFGDENDAVNFINSMSTEGSFGWGKGNIKS